MKALFNHRIFLLKVISLFILLLLKVQPNNELEITEIEPKTDSIQIKKASIPDFPKAIAVSEKKY
ncbi:hypothetical protein [Marinigracilibium pacificum]|uniref:Uncharacterized protein n=1 Tax=Marinigracilibium pacificum TaxID=2729599 RepID=A0A848IWC0_9BACT|nr:hypothetical protein [Marinigracilibium pacificum]NMM48627.1 hypothetical protein [Marinigracilibium pacificum]